MAETTKRLSDRDGMQVLQAACDDSTKTIAVSGFVNTKVGHKITLSISTTSVANDTETFSYYDGATLLSTIVNVYTDGTRTVLVSSERTS